MILPSRTSALSLQTWVVTLLRTAFLQTIFKLFPVLFMAFRRMPLLGFARRLYFSLSILCRASFIPLHTSGSAHLEHGSISSNAVENTVSTMQVVMPLGFGQLRIGSRDYLTMLTTYHGRSRSGIYYRPAVFAVVVVFSLFLVLVCMCPRCGLGQTRDYNMIPITTQLLCEDIFEAHGHCHGWPFETCRIRHVWECKRKCSVGQVRFYLRVLQV